MTLQTKTTKTKVMNQPLMTLQTKPTKPKLMNQTETPPTNPYIHRLPLRPNGAAVRGARCVVRGARILAAREAPLVSSLTRCRMNGVTSLPLTPDLLKRDAKMLNGWKTIKPAGFKHGV